MIRVFDIILSLLGIILLSPFFIVFSLLILLSSPGGIFFLQQRVGKNNIDFKLIKFRTMRPGSEQSGQLTIGARDPRITGIGFFLRRFKFDELPQLFNVLFGQMSMVGPRPEVRKYVSLYSKEQQKVLLVKPGITDLASIRYIKENELLAASKDPEQTYIHEIMPEKLKINLEYINNQSVGNYFKIIFKTIGKLFS